MTYIRKTQDEWIIYQYILGSWEEVCAAATRKEGHDLLRDYRTNEPQYPSKLLKKRVLLTESTIKKN